MKSNGILLLQCRYCHAVRYCDRLCLNGHWREGHGSFCQPALFALSPDAPPVAPPPQSTVGAGTTAAAGATSAAAAASADEGSADAAFDAAVAAVLVAAGVTNAYGVARALYEEEFDVETLRISSFDDVEEFGVVDEATMQRIHECLPAPRPPSPSPPPQASAAAAAEVEPTPPAATKDKDNDNDKEGPKPPAHLCCPIILELFTDPVTASDGETYERSAIERHIRDKQKMLRDAQQELEDTNGESERAQRVLANGMKSPMGHGVLENTALVPARIVKRLADEWRGKYLGSDS